MIVDIISAILFLSGAAFAVTASIGIIRFPDTLTRMHAATKPQTFGLLLLLAGAIVQMIDSVDVWMLVLVGLFTMITAPAVAHRVGRVAYQEQRLRDRTIERDQMETGSRD
ncbi:Na+/H+ antiporter subunit G [Tsukamurella pulmonis]|uniref:Multisubunit sodium/proton antiporter, MrpG subunit n=1 Tax=Tsukamurella pulmonis TaxID=47312 RepID=A0A1H1BUU3_9ACTN|nr:monovalent cation/H(+) antiporter subunit G [Tsukamurella pulmonis]KXO90194.1 cation:proton antiporter [Tsukamurella pulmonis]KXP11447.1 cation:proton antiporter [Tsukamurella pulmonis]RDH10522.1 monovalent cation/H(+) antiporter subunit G [Tsukamurella pulmonis]SDQ55671.1 multisubunit sodium/proton antiporter, MrpG subunit [Tsukamurella pulmonis]SUP24629.1 Multiple resistance and pH homeostasis protein G [Tsukamurella pulmonis]